MLACAERVSVHVFPPAVIDRDGLHRSNLRGLREALWACQPAEACLVDGFKLGPPAPPHRAVVDGDEKSAAIAAASIVAKVTRDRYMHALDACYPRLRLLLARRLHHAVAQRRGAPDRAERDPPPVVPGALLPRAMPSLELVAGRRARTVPRQPVRAAGGVVVPAARLPRRSRRTCGSPGTSSTSSRAAARTVVFCEVKSKAGPRLRRPARDGDAREGAARPARRRDVARAARPACAGFTRPLRRGRGARPAARVRAGAF